MVLYNWDIKNCCINVNDPVCLSNTIEKKQWKPIIFRDRDVVLEYILAYCINPDVFVVCNEENYLLPEKIASSDIMNQNYHNNDKNEWYLYTTGEKIVNKYYQDRSLILTLRDYLNMAKEADCESIYIDPSETSSFVFHKSEIAQIIKYGEAFKAKYADKIQKAYYGLDRMAKSFASEEVCLCTYVNKLGKTANFFKGDYNRLRVVFPKKLRDMNYYSQCLELSQVVKEKMRNPRDTVLLLDDKMTFAMQLTNSVYQSLIRLNNTYSENRESYEWALIAEMSRLMLIQ